MEHVPNRWSAALFAAKSNLLRAQRIFSDVTAPVARWPQGPRRLPFPAAQSTTPLWTDPSASEQWYQRGKVTNLARAAERIDGCLLPAGAVFSFWKQVGRATERRGFLPGRMLQEGCLIPSIGGGLCQLSNALYQVALDSGCDILERHSHSRTVPGSATAAGRDATVAWNYIDLRFRVPDERQLSVRITGEHLVVTMLANKVSSQEAHRQEHSATAAQIDHDRACDTCAEEKCFRHLGA